MIYTKKALYRAFRAAISEAQACAVIIITTEERKLKQSLATFVKSKAFFHLALVLLSAAVFILIYGWRVLNPGYVDWLMAGGDLSQHYLGWMSFRNSPWLFPVGLTRELSWPFATSVIFTDSIPLFAVFFKLFRFLLPADFQYFGLWGICSFMLQGLLAGKISELFLKDKIQILFVSLLVVLSPPVLQRMFGHTSLAGHWILLLALYAFIRGGMPLKKECVLWAAIGFLAASAHIYFIAMCGFVAAGVFLKKILNGKKAAESLLPCFCYLLAAVFAVWLWGGFSSETTHVTGIGLGYYSMNLNAFFNPQGFSYFLKDLPKAELDAFFDFARSHLQKGNGQYEGFAYLGAGMIFLFAYALLQFFQTENVKRLLGSWRNWLPLALVFAFTFFFAASNIVTFGETALYKIPLPSPLERCWMAFRSSGRFSWLCVYIIIFFAVRQLSRIDKKGFLRGVFIFAFVLQWVDLHEAIGATHDDFSTIKQYSSAFHESAEWQNLMADDAIKHILLATSAYVPLHEDLFAITNLALENHKTLNRFYFARGTDSVSDDYFREAVKNPSADSAYIFMAEDEAEALSYNLNLRRAGNYLIGTVRGPND